MSKHTSDRITRHLARALILVAAVPIVMGAASTAAGASVTKVGSTGSVEFYEPACTNDGYDFVAKTCTYGYANVYQSSSNPVYKDVNVWANGKLIQSTREVTQCAGGVWLCGMVNAWTVWMYPGTTSFAPDQFKLSATKGVTYTFQTTVWFWESGRWISNSLTRQITA